jgi:hypothetical protein
VASARPADALSPGLERVSREQEARLTAAFHDVAAAFARAHGKEEGRLTVTLLIRRRVNEEQAGYERRADASLPLGGHEARKQRVA